MARPDITPGQGIQTKELSRRAFLGVGLGGAAALGEQVVLASPLSSFIPDSSISHVDDASTVAAGKFMDTYEIHSEVLEPLFTPEQEEYLRGFYGEHYTRLFKSHELEAAQVSAFEYEQLPDLFTQVNENVALGLRGWSPTFDRMVDQKILADLDRGLKREVSLGGYLCDGMVRGPDGKWRPRRIGDKGTISISASNIAEYDLLVSELARESLLMGGVEVPFDSAMKQRAAQIAITGEEGSDTPSAAAMYDNKLLTIKNDNYAVEQLAGRTVTPHYIDKHGHIHEVNPENRDGITGIEFDKEQANGHHIPRVFKEYLDKQGELGRMLAGFPIGEPYQTNVNLTYSEDGRNALRREPVVFQTFERRTMVYNPAMLGNRAHPEYADFATTMGNDGWTMYRTITGLSHVPNDLKVPNEVKVSNLETVIEGNKWSFKKGPEVQNYITSINPDILNTLVTKYIAKNVGNPARKFSGVELVCYNNPDEFPPDHGNDFIRSNAARIEGVDPDKWPRVARFAAYTTDQGLIKIYYSLENLDKIVDPKVRETGESNVASIIAQMIVDGVDAVFNHNRVASPESDRDILDFRGPPTSIKFRSPIFARG